MYIAQAPISTTHNFVNVPRRYAVDHCGLSDVRTKANAPEMPVSVLNGGAMVAKQYDSLSDFVNRKLKEINCQPSWWAGMALGFLFESGVSAVKSNRHMPCWVDRI